MKRKLAFLGAILLAAFIFTYEGNTYQTHALDEEDQAWIEEARGALQNIVEDREVMALVYLCDDLTIRAEAAEDSTKVVTVPSGQMVEIRDVTVDENYQVWEKVSAEVKGKVYEGYIPRDYLACSDERFLEWEELYGMNPGAAVMLAEENATGVYADIEQFPESYRQALQALKQKHPNWTFVRQNTGLDFQTAVNNELQGGKSLVYKSYGDYCKEGQHSPNWYFASEDVLKLYMDPRNSLHENAIFQFEQLTYNESYHTEAAVETFLKNTFMNSNSPAPKTDMTFSHIFWAIGAEQQVSPFHLAARVYQEQGQGTSPLISGNYPGYEGYYNYFNISASGSTNEQVITNGLNYAQNNGWDNAYASILGGANVISANYIKKGQDTLYLQKFNVSTTASNPVYTHQYMQNIAAPTSEALSMKKLYESAGALENTFVFKIPVYENMPASPCPMPTSSTNVVLQVPAGYDASTIYVDGIPYTPQVRNNRRIVTVPNGNAQAAVVYRYNENGAPIGMYVWTLEYRNNAYAVTEQPGLTDLLTYHGFSIRITGKAGIRFKTGISADLRNTLLTGGVNGYYLKEYGTLVMNNANRNTYPMIKGGEKVISGLAYGTDSNGAHQDSIYETVDGRYRYTSVLVGLPADQYKVEYAFRGYIVLTKDNKDITIYGPAMAKSIYSLAEQVLNMGTYASGSEADAFLRKLISDAK
ncbi:N-acetylglucosaminidase [Phocaeicola coprocola]|uniref:N-acetylglucosaminidase n=1 Tax=Phocaeicola coprocola TaxID=310298 RepID=UPI004029122A